MTKLLASASALDASISEAFTITTKQLSLLHHTLGLTPERREPCRNHFIAGPGHHDQLDLEALETAGLMVRGRTPSFCYSDDVVFRVADAGREYAITMLPPTPKYSRYEQYRRSECNESFSEWLGIETPKREYASQLHGTRVQAGLVRLTTSRATGGWAQTIKAAKVSYKAALKASRGAPC